jgi:hypothetical protein
LLNVSSFEMSSTLFSSDWPFGTSFYP